MLRPYKKQPLAIPDQIEKLKSKGLLFENDSSSEHFLKNNNYYRFSGYTYSFRNQSCPNRFFKKGTYFEDIVSLYHFDSQLRSFILNAIEKIEIAFRTQIINQYSITHKNSHWNQDPSHFLKISENSVFLNDMNNYLGKCKDEFVLHYKKNYNFPENPPCWVYFELMNFGQLTSLYENLNTSTSCKVDIAKYFGFTKTRDLEQWMRALRMTRNICAHHSRLWNKSISANILQNSKNLQRPFIENIPVNPNQNKIYAIICGIQYLLNIIEPSNDFRKELKLIMKQKSKNELKAMGFVKDWEKEPFWNKK